MELYEIIEPLGILTWCLLLFGVLTGTRVIKLKLKHHKWIGFIAIGFATLHGALVLFFA